MAESSNFQDKKKQSLYLGLEKSLATEVHQVYPIILIVTLCFSFFSLKETHRKVKL